MSNMDPLIKRGEAYFDEGLFDHAIANYSRAIAAGNRDAQLYCLRSKAYLAKAWELAGRAPYDEEAYAKWEAVFSGKRELQLALDDALRAVSLDAKSGEAYYGLGVIQIDKKCWAAAIAAFDKCLELAPGDYEALYWRAVAYDELGDTAKTLENLGEVMALTAECSEAYYMRSQVHTGRENFEEALADISKAIELDPGAPEYYLQRGEVLLYLAEKPEGAAHLGEAIKDLSEALRLDPEYAEAYNWRSQAYLQAGDYEKELKDLASLIELEPAYAEAYRRRYECRVACGHRAAAARDWLYLCYLKPGALLDPITEAARNASSGFKKFSGN
jgi:tetratricopeptide (TPR) repeat protein